MIQRDSRHGGGISAYIREIRSYKGMSRADLAARAEVHEWAVFNIESGRIPIPRADTLLSIMRALEVAGDELSDLIRLETEEDGVRAAREWLEKTQHNALEIDLNHVMLTMANGEPAAIAAVLKDFREKGLIMTPASPSDAQPANDPRQELRLYLEDLKNDIGRIGEQVTTLQTGSDKELGERVEMIQATIQQMTTTTDRLTAPVHLPARENMAITLIPSTAITLLEQYNGDAQLWSMFFGVGISAVLGMIAAMALTPTLTFAAWALLVVFSLFTMLAAQQWRVAVKRARLLKDVEMKRLTK